jgi:hypothetical protein
MTAENLLQRAARTANIKQTLAVLDDIEYRRAVSQDEIAAIADIRQQAYENADIYIGESPSFTDAVDFDPRAYVFGVYWREMLVGTMRIHVLSSDNPKTNSTKYFPDVLDPLVAQGLTFMDPARFAILPGMDKQIPSLAPIVLRLGLAAVRHFNCDFGLATIKEGHAGFYRRVFNYTQMTPLQSFPPLKQKFALFSTSQGNIDAVCSNFPVLDGVPTEAKLLFSNVNMAKPAVLSVRPTARLALRNKIAYPDLLQAAE